MIKQLIEEILNIAYEHKLVNNVDYADYPNKSNNNDYYQFIIEDSVRANAINNTLLRLSLNIDVLGFLEGDTDALTVQDNSLHILLDVFAMMGVKLPQVQINDYSLLSLRDYTDDKSAGVRATVELTVPSPLNVCEFENNFEKKPDKPKDPDLVIDNSEDECTEEFGDNCELSLNPLKIY